jgi:biopolymer transport protein ExbD
MKLNLSNTYTAVPNMIPTIDILFQLVIFFMLACQFAVVEQFPIPVPDNCFAAKIPEERAQKVTIVTLMKSSSGELELAVGPEKITAADGKAMSAEIASLINDSIRNQPPQNRIVSLRIAKDIPFEQSQYAIKGVAISEATDIQMSVLKDKSAE